VAPATTAQHDRIDWFATAYADPSKPPFVVTFRNVLSPRETWETDAKKPAAFIVDGKRHELKPYQSSPVRTINRPLWCGTVDLDPSLKPSPVRRPWRSSSEAMPGTSATGDWRTAGNC